MQTGIPMSYIIVLNEDPSGNPPDGEDAAKYATSTKVTTIPVTADPISKVLDATPWTGLARPGKCALSPEMVMIDCWVGEDDTAGLAAIEADAAKR